MAKKQNLQAKPKNLKTFKDQAERDFIESKLDQNLFVEASAGTGKTYELEHRVVNLFKDPKRRIAPARIAIITFTNKAAAELKYRVRHALETALHNATPAERPALEEKLSHLEEARISTIHSFCLELLREMPVEFGIDPKVQVLDEEEAELIFSRVLAAVLNE
jgi:ATP-dependent helicase/nuclease subunit A